MTTYIVGYDIHPTKGETYTELIDALKAYGTYWHHLDSTWVIVTNQTATQVRDNLAKHLKADDQLLVVSSGGVGAWQGFEEKGSKWLKDHL